MKGKEADAEVAEACRRVGIPERFRPSLHMFWMNRGENGLKERRVELRRVAQTRLAAEGRKGKLSIDSAALEMLTTLATGALKSAEAKAFLESMPTPENLIPALELQELEAGVSPERRLWQ